MIIDVEVGFRGTSVPFLLLVFTSRFCRSRLGNTLSACSRLIMSRLFSKRQRLQILVRDHWTCCYCGEKLQPGSLTHIDHVIPFSQGGRTTVDNGVASCRRCNLLKSASFDHELT
jgi:hypothetical protein